MSQLLDESGVRVGAHRVFRRGDDVLPGLAMSRSLGDIYAHAVGVTNEPVLSTHTLSDRDLFLVGGRAGGAGCWVLAGGGWAATGAGSLSGWFGPLSLALLGACSEAACVLASAASTTATWPQACHS